MNTPTGLHYINQTGDSLSVVCNGNDPRVRQDGGHWSFTLVGDTGQVQCSGLDHHGNVIASQAATLDHHHLNHSMTLRLDVTRIK